LGLTLIQMFQTFKLNMAFFMKFNIFFFKMKNLYVESKEEVPLESKRKFLFVSVLFFMNKASNLNNEFTQDQLNILRKFLMRQKNMGVKEENVNKYEKIEKARFYLEQEAQDLDQMLLVFKAAKDEIDEFIRKKVNLKLIKPSGVTKLLQNIVRDAKAQSITLNTLLEKGFWVLLFYFNGLFLFNFESIPINPINPIIPINPHQSP